MRGSVLVSRSSGADLHLKPNSVSRRHALLHVEDGAVFIEDLRSKNGVRVNGQRVSDKAGLAPHDILAIDTVTAVLDGRVATRNTAMVERPSLPTPAIADASDPAAAPMRIELPNVQILIADPGMRRVYALIEQLAVVDLPVLLGGETGTGKELAAAALHHWSRRRERPFVALNCAALPERLVETELFGATKGAYSGRSPSPASSRKPMAGRSSRLARATSCRSPRAEPCADPDNIALLSADFGGPHSTPIDAAPAAARPLDLGCRR